MLIQLKTKPKQTKEKKCRSFSAERNNIIDCNDSTDSERVTVGAAEGTGAMTTGGGANEGSTQQSGRKRVEIPTVALNDRKATTYSWKRVH